MSGHEFPVLEAFHGVVKQPGKGYTNKLSQERREQGKKQSNLDS